MTSRQFACLNCKQYINAGYRWCHTHLERPGIVTVGELLDVERVLATAEYWAIPAAGQTTSAWLDGLPPRVSEFVRASPLVQTSTGWLEKLLPEVRAFLLCHRKHELRIGEAANAHFYSYSSNDFLEWDDVEDGEPHDISVQSLCTQGCRGWADVEIYMKSRQLPVWWWGQPSMRRLLLSTDNFETYSFWLSLLLRLHTRPQHGARWLSQAAPLSRAARVALTAIAFRAIFKILEAKEPGNISGFPPPFRS